MAQTIYIPGLKIKLDKKSQSQSQTVYVTNDTDWENAFETDLLNWINGGLIPAGYQREYRAVKGRKWRADFAWPDQMVIVEIQGGVFSRGRHTRGAGYTADRRRQNALTAEGWRVFEATPEMVRTGEILKLLSEKVFKIGKAKAKNK